METEEKKKTIQTLYAKEAANLVCELWQTYQDKTVSFRARMLDFYRQYRGISVRKNYAGLANLFINETLSAIESIVAQEVSTIYSEGRRLLIVGREETDEKNQKLIEDLMEAFLDKANDREVMTECLRRRAKYGTVITYVGWDYQSKEILGRQKDDAGGYELGKRKKVVLDRPWIEPVDLTDIALDPCKSNIEDMKWVIWRKRVSYNDLLVDARRGLYSLDEVKKCKQQGGGKKNYGSGSKDKVDRLNSIGINYSGLEQEELELLCYWGIAPRLWVEDDLDPNSEEAQDLVECVIEVVKDKRITIRMEMNPYWHQEKPFEMAQYIGVDGEAFGVGVCEISESLQAEINDNRNRLADHSSLQIMPPLVRNKNSGIKKEDVILAPHKIIDSDMPPDQALRSLQIGGNALENVQVDAIAKQDLRNTTGASNPVQGISSNKDTTAFEVGVLERRGSSRINLSTMDFGNKFLKKIYRKIYKLIQQYVSQDTAIRIVGPEGVRWAKVTPEDVLYDYDFIPIIPTDIESRIIIRNQMIQFLQSLAPYYPGMNVYHLIRKIYSLFGYNDTDDVIPAPDSEKGQMELNDKEEIYVLSQGQKIDVKFYDNHIRKLAILLQYLDMNGTALTPAAQEAFKDKILQHQKYLEVLQGTMQDVMGGRMGGGGAENLGSGNLNPMPAGQTGGANEPMRNIQREVMSGV